MAGRARQNVESGPKINLPFTGVRVPELCARRGCYEVVPKGACHRGALREVWHAVVVLVALHGLAVEVDSLGVTEL